MQQTMGSGFRSVPLEFALPTLAISKRVWTSLTKEWGAKRLPALLEMMGKGRLTGDLADDVHNFFTDEIVNESKTVWTGWVPGRDDDYGVYIQSYEGVYYVYALEEDDVGYFLSLEDAKAYVFLNWNTILVGRVE